MAAHAIAPAAVMTEAEYLSSEFEITPDFVDGRLEGRNLGEIEHANWARALMFWFAQTTNLFVLGEVHVLVARGRYRIADIAVFAQPPQGRYVTEPPLAVIEILSPSDSFRTLKGRMRDYERMGVKNLFVVEGRTEFSEFREDTFFPVQGGRSRIEGSEAVLRWDEASKLLWPNDAAQTE